MIKQLDKWHKTKLGLLVFAFVELVAVYAFISLAIDRGNFLYYFLALIFLIGSLQNLYILIRKLIHGRRQS